MSGLSSRVQRNESHELVGLTTRFARFLLFLLASESSKKIYKYDFSFKSLKTTFFKELLKFNSK